MVIKERVQARMKALRLKIKGVQRRMGLPESVTYINDFLKGRQTFADVERIQALAVALECSVEYLTGESGEVGSPPSGVVIDLTPEPSLLSSESAPTASQPPRKLVGRGFVEAGAFRKPGGISAAFDADEIIHPLADAQSVYKVRDDSLLDIGVTRESLLLCADADDVAAVESGTIVIVEHTRHGGEEIEISARKLQHFPNRTELRIVTPTNGAETLTLRDGRLGLPDNDARIVARVLLAVRPL